MNTSTKQISANPPALKIQQRAELFDLIRDVANADGAVIGRAGLRLLVDERLCARREAVAAVRIAHAPALTRQPERSVKGIEARVVVGSTSLGYCYKLRWRSD